MIFTDTLSLNTKGFTDIIDITAEVISVVHESKVTNGLVTVFCTGCGACAGLSPVSFMMRDEKAWVINHEKFIIEEHKSVMYACPFRAITIE